MDFRLGLRIFFLQTEETVGGAVVLTVETAFVAAQVILRRIPPAFPRTGRLPFSLSLLDLYPPADTATPEPSTCTRHAMDISEVVP
jgi:hypothetical protein